MKLRHDHPESLGVFQTLETLGLGILGKRFLWIALKVISEMDSRVSGLDFEALARNASDQFDRVEEFRLRTARAAFNG
jgi:hypothetical protein